ncbi:CYTH-like domain containing protein [Nitzschia inconspicua]|uniref:CYTH-like domain containing protein n=1 Tax=Nitzschia inconspicua TaxID=303405 RepID=A0A9K3LG82_9STRA|nr:CYTH-like domain containing protein [Nitzschia inconspicua]
MILEVEQKFRIDNYDDDEISSRLRTLGFRPEGTAVTFTDWYFDDLSSLALSLKDCWLRYREMGGHGEWQLKRGKSLQPGTDDSTSKSTVYEEVEGLEAVDIALAVIQSDNNTALRNEGGGIETEGHGATMKDFPAPSIPTSQAHSLQPFVRLVTNRTSWILSHAGAHTGSSATWNGKIRVDLDTTNTHYAVGEVETVVNSEDQVPEAQAVVQRVIELLVGNSENNTSPSPPIGKLEHFLLHFRPNHYQTLIQSGVLLDADRVKN